MKKPVLNGSGHDETGSGGVTRSVERGTLLPLAAVALSMLALMALFEFLKAHFDFGLLAWQSSAATIAFSCVLATVFVFIARRGILKKGRELEQERDLLRTVTEGVPGGIFAKDLDGRYLSVNQRFVHDLEADSSSSTGGKVPFDFMPPELAAVVAAEDIALKSGKTAMIEREKSTVDDEGNVRWHVTTKVPLLGTDGRIVGIAGVQHDTTRSKRLEQELREQEARLLAAQQIGQFGSFEVDLIDGADLEWCEMRCSTELLRIAGFKPGDADSPRSSTNIFHLVAPEDWAQTKEAMDKTIREAKPYVLDFRIVCSDGTQRMVQGAGDVLCDAQTGKPLKLQGTIHDITDRKRAEAQLKEANANLANRVQELQRRSNELHLLSEMGGWLQSCNTIDEAYVAIASSVEPLFPEWIGALYVIGATRNVVEVVAEWGTPVRGERVFAPDDCWALRRGRLNWSSAGENAMRCRHADAALGAESVCVPLMAHGEALGILHLQPKRANVLQLEPSEPPVADRKLASVLAEQISLALGNLKLREALRNQSIRDPLTGLFNRRYMEESLEREISRANRDRSSIAIIMLDIDHFKEFNDTFGHQAGDMALHTVGEFLKGATRGQDIVCRYGGEEFALVLSGSTLEGALERGEVLRNGVKQLEVQYRGQLLGTMTVSMGLALFPDHGSTIADVLRGADQALYCAKRDGRDQICVWTVGARAEP